MLVGSSPIHGFVVRPFQFRAAATSLVFLSMGLSSTVVRGDDDASFKFFEDIVRPLLIERCYECHGAKGKPKGGLRLDSRPALIRGGESGPAIVVGKSDKSLLIEALHYLEEPKMPPSGKLSDAEIQSLSRWIDEGAVWPDSPPSVESSRSNGFEITPEQRAFWSFQPIKKNIRPELENEAWAKSDIDAFVLRKLEDAKLKPAQEADRRALIRRATFDLTGLPPTPGEVESFVDDRAEGDPFARVVDRLLASPRYGERWGRHWLDLVRYTDSFDSRIAGSNNEMDVNDSYRYRDWVVDALNRDLPYDSFLTDQIAGDLLPAPTSEGVNREGIIATGMLAIGNWGGGDADKEKLLTDIADDQVDVVSRVFMGLTVACARCHDHKFDPISTKDYYGLAGIFFSTHILPNVGPKTNGPPMLRIPLTSEADRAKQDKTVPVETANGAQEGGVPGSPQEGCHDVRVHIRGSYARLGDMVPRHFPVVLAGEAPPTIPQGSGRLELAKWLSKPENPLTARVMANRIWQQHFGSGIVRTPSNFGKLGEAPSHPELLDHLAGRLIQLGWSLKALHREIMLTATYRQSTSGDPETFKADPDNRLFGRANSRRLDAESMRDAMLATSGRLDERRGGPAFRDVAESRRTIYMMTIRSDRTSFGPLFDAADPTAIVDARTVSTVAPQALFLLNNGFVLDSAKALAVRLKRERPGDDPSRIDLCHSLLFGRKPTDEERRAALETLSIWMNSSSEGMPPDAAWDSYCHILYCSNEFLYLD